MATKTINELEQGDLASNWNGNCQLVWSDNSGSTYSAQLTAIANQFGYSTNGYNLTANTLTANTLNAPGLTANSYMKNINGYNLTANTLNAAGLSASQYSLYVDAVTLTANSLRIPDFFIMVNSSLLRSATFYASIYPGGNGTYDLGNDHLKWKNIYATTGTINTSDSRCKSDINSLSTNNDALLSAIDAIDLVSFKMNDSIAQKGQDKARIHAGIIAQDALQKFEALSVDPTRYGFFCHDVISGDQLSAHNLTADWDQYSIRYSEFLVLKCAAQDKKIKSLEENLEQKTEQILNLTQRLEQLEQKIN